jgi:HD superfamily phosphohydrolase YqeK
MKIPTLALAEQVLVEAAQLNPGPWVQHSRNVALGAKLIAEQHPRLNPETSYVLGLLHDIGRREGPSHIRHLIDGYRYLAGLGYEEVGRISLTHSFPVADLSAYFGERDCSAEDLNFLEAYITTTKFSEYDRLIQLCDTLSMPEGFCLMEKRLVDVAMRYGTSEVTVKGWEARFKIKAEFEAAIGESIYCILPGIVEGTFGIKIP